MSLANVGRLQVASDLPEAQRPLVRDGQPGCPLVIQVCIPVSGTEALALKIRSKMVLGEADLVRRLIPPACLDGLADKVQVVTGPVVILPSFAHEAVSGLRHV